MAKIVHSLSSGWSFKDRDTDEWLPVASVPSVVQQDLIANKKIGCPLGQREVMGLPKCRTEAIHPAGSSIVLVFDGLDTFAKVKLDGQVILESDNMFLGHRVDVTEALEAEGEHTLEIEFDCALIKARELRAKDTTHKWVGFNGDPSRMAARKAQYHWGWDWGPVLMTAGIWRAVRFEVYQARVANVWPKTQLSADHQTAEVTAVIDVESVGDGDYTAQVSLGLKGKEIASQTIPVSAKAAQVIFSVDKPALWWPHGYGEQTLYDVSVSLLRNGEQVDQTSKKFGIRTAEVVQQPDKHGKSFFFRINGMDIFCGGSCWIPADSLLPAISAERYRKWIELMVAGRQVMIRVWGGGIYEDDSFYEACDELGVLVWQDFMFGCGNYPTWPEMLESVRQETIYNLERMRHHPSIVLYAGNNEDYQVAESEGLTYNYEDKDPENWLKTDFPARYIYEKLLPDVVAEYSPGTFYHPGSPWGDGKISSDPTVGDMHHVAWNAGEVPNLRYSRRPVQQRVRNGGIPHLSTIDYFVENPEDKFPQSHVIDFHNKADGHERRLATYLVENLRTATDLETYIYLTQVVQAETMMFGYRGWRRQWGDERHCGGALLWQLNDCWPTISWAIVDYFLKPKPAYYAVKRVMNPIAVGVRREHHDWSVAHAQPPKTSKYELWIASNQPKTVQGSVELRFLSVNTGRDIRAPIVRENITIAANGTTDIIADGVLDHIAEPEPHVLAARLWVDNKVVARDVDWPQPLKYLNLSERQVEVKRQTGKSGETVLVINARKPVKCLVFEEQEGVQLEDNAIDIVPGDEQTVTVTGLGSERLRYRYLGQASCQVVE
ncbi:hypothetical protein N7497_009177 [Penicillium chrysogenum]|nr:hypothetical protein N7497_009177 [Penicillium chrysogenum]